METRLAPVGKVTTAAMIAAPVLLLASTIAYAAAGEVGTGVVGGVIQVYAFAAFGLATAGLAWASVRAGSRRAVAWLVIVAALGVAGGAGYGINAIYAGLGASDLNSDGSLAGAIALQVPGVLFPLSLIGFGVLLARLKAVPWLLGGLLAVAAASFPAGRIPKVGAVALATDLLLIVALVGVAWVLGRGVLEGTPEKSTVSAHA